MTYSIQMNKSLNADGTRLTDIKLEVTFDRKNQACEVIKYMNEGGRRGVNPPFPIHSFSKTLLFSILLLDNIAI